MELLYALKNKEVDAAFFSSNYADMFYSLDGYENIKDETVVLYEKTKKYDYQNEPLNKLYLADRLDNYILYNDISDDLIDLYSSYNDIEYKKYENNYEKINYDTIKKQLNNKINL